MSKPLKVLKRGDEHELAEQVVALLEREGHDHLVTDGRVYEYRDGLFVAVDDLLLKQTVLRFKGCKKRGSHEPIKISSSFVNGTVALVKVITGESEYFPGAADGIVFGSQFVRVTVEDGIVTEGLSPDHRARFGYPFELPELGVAPLLDRVRATPSPSDPDGGAKGACLEEAAGRVASPLALKKCSSTLAPPERARARC